MRANDGVKDCSTVRLMGSGEYNRGIGDTLDLVLGRGCV